MLKGDIPMWKRLTNQMS